MPTSKKPRRKYRHDPNRTHVQHLILRSHDQTYHIKQALQGILKTGDCKRDQAGDFIVLHLVEVDPRTRLRTSRYEHLGPAVDNLGYWLDFHAEKSGTPFSSTAMHAFAAQVATRVLPDKDTVTKALEEIEVTQLEMSSCGEEWLDEIMQAMRIRQHLERTEDNRNRAVFADHKDAAAIIL